MMNLVAKVSLVFSFVCFLVAAVYTIDVISAMPLYATDSSGQYLGSGISGSCPADPEFSYGNMVRIRYRLDDFYRTCQDQGIVMKRAKFYNERCDAAITYYTVRVMCQDSGPFASITAVDIEFPYTQLSLDQVAK
jgi:hypothetical protein